MSSVDPETLIARDSATMLLAHPLRCAAAWRKAPPPWPQVLGEHTWDALAKAFRNEGRITPDVITEMHADPRHRLLANFVNYTAQDASSTELGGAYATALYWRHLLVPQPYFVVEDALLEMLEHTDISDDLPMSVLKPPYSRCYIEFGKSRTCQQQVPNTTTGLHVLEGAYIEEGGGESQGAGLFITFTGSPVGKAHALDDATDSLFLPTGDPTRLIQDVMAEARANSQRMAAMQDLRSSPEEFTPYAFSCLKLLVKVLLYIGLPEARKSLHPEHTVFKKQVEAKKNPAKRAQAQKQLAYLKDYILVTAPAPRSAPGLGTGGADSGMRRHWRRGHYRLQPHGPQSSLRKVIFMQPMLVGTTTGDLQAAPNYRVR